MVAENFGIISAKALLKSAKLRLLEGLLESIKLDFQLSRWDKAWFFYYFLLEGHLSIQILEGSPVGHAF